MFYGVGERMTLSIAKTYELPVGTLYHCRRQVDLRCSCGTPLQSVTKCDADHRKDSCADAVCHARCHDHVQESWSCF